MQFSSLKHAIFSTPAHLFIGLWAIANDLTTHQRTTADPCDDLRDLLSAALAQDSGSDASAAVVDILRHLSTDLVHRRNGGVLAAMQAIDDEFLHIHPRHRILPKVTAKRHTQWLIEQQEERLMSGFYAEDAGLRLIARGPLTTKARGQFSSSGESIADYFTGLTLAPAMLKNAHRTIDIHHIVVPVGGLTGVDIGEIGKEKVGFVPVAKKVNELTLSCRADGKQKFLEVGLSIDAIEVFRRVIGLSGGIDILMAPELVVSESSVAELADILRTSKANHPRLLVAGSGNTSSIDDDGFSWNESAILNKFGTVLWRQKKTWTSGIGRARAEQYGLDCEEGEFLLERNAESSTVVVADLEGMGRCVTLICQDIEAKPMAADLILYYQPDWIFVPILDQGVGTGRWAHARAFELSAISAARYLISSSLSLVPRPITTLPVCGLAIGPKQAIDKGVDGDRAFQNACIDPDSDVDMVEIQWRNGDWKQTSISALDYPGKP
jgi:hypothetical protein